MSTLLVSDFSSTAYTYALSMQRPVIFFSHNEARLQEYIFEYGPDDYCRMREKVGFVVTNNDEMVSKIQILLNSFQEFNKKIVSVCNAYLFQLGNSSQYVADHIDIILRRKCIKNWKTYYLPEREDVL